MNLNPVADTVQEGAFEHLFFIEDEELVPDGALIGRDHGSRGLERGTVKRPARTADSAFAIFSDRIERVDRTLIDGHRRFVFASGNRDLKRIFDLVVVVVAENEFAYCVLKRVGFRVAGKQDLDRLARLALGGRKFGDPFGLRVEAPLEVCGDLDGPPLGLHRLLLPRNGERRLLRIDRLLLVGYLAEAALFALVEVELALDGAARHGGDHLALVPHGHCNVDTTVGVVFLDIRDADNDFMLSGLAANRVGRHAVVVEPEPFARLRAIDAYRPGLIGRNGNRTSAANFDPERRFGREIGFRQI